MVVIYRVSKSVKKVHFEGKCTKKKINSTSFEIFSTALRKEKFETNVDFSSRGNSYFLKFLDQFVSYDINCIIILSMLIKGIVTRKISRLYPSCLVFISPVSLMKKKERKYQELGTYLHKDN